MESGSFLQKMKKSLKNRLLKHSLTALLFPKKHPTGRENHPEKYYRHYWVEQNMVKAVEFVAEVERIHKQDAVDMLLRLGFRHWIADKAHRNRIREIFAKARNQPIKRSRYIQKLIQLAKENGMDARKFF